MKKLLCVMSAAILLWSTQALAQDRQPGAVNLDQPTCEGRLMASKRGLVNVALQVTELEAQVEYWKQRVEVATKEIVAKDAALGKMKAEEKPPKAVTEEK